MIVAETKRLLLSKVTLEDAPLFLKIMNTPEWLEFIGDRHIYSVQDAENHLNKNILKSYDDNGFGVYKVITKESENIPIGITGLFNRPELEDVDIGFAFLEKYYGKGYGYESAMEVIRMSKELFNIKKLTAITSPKNIASQRLLKKLGMSFEKRIKPWEEREDLLLYTKIL